MGGRVLQNTVGAHPDYLAMPVLLARCPALRVLRDIGIRDSRMAS